MREAIVGNENYFQSFIDESSGLINIISTKISSQVILECHVPMARYLIFVHSLESLIANYSAGTNLDDLKLEFSSTLAYMIDGWDDSVVKFKMGRPEVIYDKYLLNQYCYMIWMLSFAVLFRASKEDVTALEKLNARISDELILWYLEFLTGNKYAVKSRTTVKPFKAILSKEGFGKINTIHMAKYLKGWYKRSKLLIWHNYINSIGSTNHYYGCWSFESAAVLVMLELDDSGICDNQYYPKDLVDYYRLTSDSESDY